MSHERTTSPLLEHFQRHAGNYLGGEPAFRDGRFKGYFLGYFEKVDDEIITVISSGVRFAEDDVPFGEEVACSLLIPQAGCARFLVDITSEMILERRRGVEFDCVIDNQGELVEGSGKEGLLASAHPYFGEYFNAHYSENGSVALQVISVIPVTREEINFVAAHDAEALYDVWMKTNRTCSTSTGPPRCSQ